jgi:hypothetical protein
VQKSLLIGCGNDRTKKIFQGGHSEWTGQLVTLDMNPNCGADIVMNLGNMFSIGAPCLPFGDAEFDELGAYDSLEHWGKQGDWRGWFAEMAEYHRILKIGGLFGAIVPIGDDFFADPGHARFIHSNHFSMLNQQFYVDRLAAGAPIPDYRHCWKLNFDILHMENMGGHHLAVLLRKTA